MTRPQVVVDVAGNQALARDLAAGGVFVPDCALELMVECELVVRTADAELVVIGRVVFVDPRGVGLELVDCSAELKDQLAALAGADPYGDADDPESAAETAVFARADDDPDDAAATDTFGTVAEADASAGADEPARKIARNIHERLRGLTLVKQIHKAKHGEVSERIVLERIYGKTVWEALLRNPRITGPEVARIARMGALPRPLVEIICTNGGWLQIPEIRRALLANPRLGTDQIVRVLRLLPKHELKLAASSTNYPHPVRDAAKRLVRELG